MNCYKLLNQFEIESNGYSISGKCKNVKCKNVKMRLLIFP